MLADYAAVPVLLAVSLAPAAAQTCGVWPESLHRTDPGGAPLAFAVFDDGNGPALYAGGAQFGPPGEMRTAALMRWDGATWQKVFEFAEGSARVHTLCVHDDGGGLALFLGGWDLVGEGVSASGLVRWDGVTLTNVGTGVLGAVNALAVYDAGGGPELYVAGDFNSAGGVFTPNIVRWNGSAFAGIGGLLDLGGGVNDLLVHDDGSGPRLFAAGYFQFAGGQSVASIAAFGPSGWSALGSGIAGNVNDLLEHDFGAGPTLVAAGGYSSAGGLPAANVAVWDGAGWSALGAGTPAPVRRITTHDDGSGTRFFAALESTPTVLRSSLDGATWTVLGGTSFDWPVNSLLVHDFGGGARLYVGGGFSGTLAGLHSPYVLGWDGAQWFAPVLADGLARAGGPPWVGAQHMFGGQLYVAGGFSGAAGANAGSFARFDGTSLHALPGSGAGAINALETFDDGTGERLYAGGSFTTIGGVGPVRGIARFDGASWSALPEQSGLGSVVNWRITALAAFDDGSGPALYATGENVRATGITGIARWRDGTWSAVGGGFPLLDDDTAFTYARALRVHDGGSGPALYLGGGGFQFGGQIGALARWNGATWSFVGGANAFGPYATVHALELHDDGAGEALYAGGHFDAAGGVPAANVARWKDGTWSGVGGNAGATWDWVSALVSHDDGRGDGAALFAGGVFATVDGVPAGSLARWDGAAWSTLANGVRQAGGGVGSVASLASSVLDGRRDLYVGGVFEFAGDELATSFARWPGCGETGETLCFGDGNGSACPCGNASAVGARAGCVNSFGLAGTLRGAGESSLALDSLRLDGAGMPDSTVLYFQASTLVNGGAGVAFGDGLRCGGGATMRLGTKLNSGGASSHPAGLEPSISVQGAVLSPGTRYYQARYRNSASFCTSDVFNWTNALRVVWGA